MEVITGKAVVQGIAVGKICYVDDSQEEIKPGRITDPEAEYKKFETARSKAAEELAGLYEKAFREAGENNAAIFEVHRMLLEDEDFIDSIADKIKAQYLNAEYAVFKTGEELAGIFARMENQTMKERAIDIRDIAGRIQNILGGREDPGMTERPSIVVSKELTPSRAIRTDKTMLLGFATKYGSSNSHTMILARAMNIPAVTGIEPCMDWDGKTAVLDGYEGTLTIEPDEAVLEEKRKISEKDGEWRKRILSLRGKENITKCGKKIEVLANIGDISEIDAVLENDAGGIGLLRSEFLYLAKKEFPTEEELFGAYKTAAEKMDGKKVIIRTLDIGADKQVPYFDPGKEENPALGYRGIRICLTQTELFKTQLRAIYRAGYYGNVSVMFPMIISCEEVKSIKRIINEVKEELDAKKVPYRDMELGIMVETPAAVIMSDDLAKEVDFFSIGTNDLTQYTLAADRQNSKLESFYDPHHPAIIRSIERVVKNGHEHGCRVGICGELGADTSLTETFLRIGVDELSVSPAVVLNIREKVRSIE